MLLQECPIYRKYCDSRVPKLKDMPIYTPQYIFFDSHNQAIRSTPRAWKSLRDKSLGPWNARGGKLSPLLYTPSIRLRSRVTQLSTSTAERQRCRTYITWKLIFACGVMLRTRVSLGISSVRTLFVDSPWNEIVPGPTGCCYDIISQCAETIKPGFEGGEISQLWNAPVCYVRPVFV